jgi:ATP-binding cassette subfamily B protein
MSLHFFKHTRLGELISRLNNDVIGAQNAISNTIVSLVTNVIQAVAILIVLFTLEWRLTLVSVIIMPIFLIVTKRLANVLREIAHQAMDLNARMNAMMNETLNIGGAILVKLFGRQKTEVNRFEQRAGQVRDIGVRRAVIGVSFFVIIGLVSAIGSALVYGLGGYLVIKDALTIGTIVAFGAYLTSLYSSLEGLANAPVEFATSMVSFERVFEVIDLPRDIPEKENAIVLKDVHGQLTFDRVCFRYDDQSGGLSDVRRFGRVDQVDAVLSDQEKDEQKSDEEQPASQARVTALEDISFQANPGQLVALVGPSGAGKTTLTYLIPRLYDPNEGRVMIDGIDVRDVTLDSLSDQIGMVTQETYLFHDTIRTNLSYAHLDASQTELENAAKAANIHDFIMDLPNGYDTIVGERGYRLSGGEKQRIALARVILKDPRILVLDEATSHLDSESEALIQDALKRVMAGRTSIVIAHRLSTILAADQILVIDRGKIVESGTHAELIAVDGIYAHLYRTQFAEKY